MSLGFLFGFMVIVAALVALNGELVVRRWDMFQGRYVNQVAQQFEDLYIARNPGSVFVLHMLGIAAAFFVFTFGVGLVFGMIMAFAAWSVPTVLLARARQRRAERFDVQLIDALTSMANSVRAGLVLPQAMQVVVESMDAPISQEFSLMLKEHRLGLTLEDALQAMGRRLKSRFFDMVVTGILITRIHGGNISQIFEDTSQAIREIHRLEEQVKTMTAQGRMQGWVIGAMPALFAIIVYLLDREYIAILWRDPVGWVILTVIALFEVIGVFLIRRILNADI